MTSTDDADTAGGSPPEPVEDRPNVSTVKPEDYPDASAEDRAASDMSRPVGRDEQMEQERLFPGSSSGSTPAEIKPAADVGKNTRVRESFNGNEA